MPDTFRLQHPSASPLSVTTGRIMRKVIPSLISPNTNINSNQTNVKSIVIATQAFIPTANPTRAVVIAITAGAICMPTKMTLGISGYLTSKLAQVKMMEYLAAENPNMFACSVHPGMIETSIFLKSGATPDMLPMDTGL